jgi:hypothetical protein
MPSSVKTRRFLTTAILVGLPPVVLAGAWRLGGVSALEDDLLYYFPVRAFIGQHLAGGTVPLWNPYVAMGTSIAADPQAGLWYPPTWLFALLPAVVAYPVTICLHFTLAGGGLYRFLRSTGREPRAALFGAVAFQFCGFLVAHRAHLTILEAAAWLPWLLYAWHRLAVSGRHRYWALATIALGAQLFVQHVQVTLMTLAITAAYAAFVLVPRRRAILWELPLSVLLGVALGAIQLVPTFAAFAASGRAAPAYYLFVENSYVPTSFFLWLFPMIFGTRTPNFYDQPWWGWSHFCEQSTYASQIVLVFAAAAMTRWRRDAQVRFWSVAGAVCLVLAMGRFTPLYKLLFHVPLLSSFRVPARWLLAVNLSLAILAAAMVDAMLRDTELAARARRAAWWVASRLLPAAVAGVVVCMLIARARPGLFPNETIAADVRQAIQPANPAIWVPLLLTAATILAIRAATGGSLRRRYPLWLAILILDLASVAAFVDVDTRTYASVRDMLEPDLAATLKAAPRDAGDRLWVPRAEADYRRPAEVLWPHINTLYGIPTFNGYGPLWPLGNRLLFRFLPWGASHDVLRMLYNPELLRAMGVRWLAARTAAERELIATANRGIDHIDWQRVPRPAEPVPSSRPEHAGTLSIDTQSIGARTIDNLKIKSGPFMARWPVTVDEPGVYALDLAFASPGSRNWWLLWIESEQHRPMTETRWFEPADGGGASRVLRCYFRCGRAAGGAPGAAPGEASGEAFIAVWADPYARVGVQMLRFGRVVPGRDSEGPYRRVAHVSPDGVELYELADPCPRFYWATRATAAENIVEAAQKLQEDDAGVGLPSGIVTLDVPAGWAVSPRAAAQAGPRIVRESVNAVTLDVTGSNGVLVFDESFDRGWQATIDGSPAPVKRANIVTQAIYVPRGATTVRLAYWPAGLTWGIMVTLGGVLAILAAAMVNARRRAA